MRVALVLSLVTLSMVIPALGSAAVLQLSADEVSYGITDVAAAEFASREMINEERAAQGFGTLASFDDLIDDARTQALDTSEAGYLYHNPDLADVTASANWFKLGENVGYGPTVDVLHQAFMDSPAHEANLLNEVYNYVGVGATIDEGGTIWVAMVFMHGPDGLASASEQGPVTYVLPFMDDDQSSHADAIAAIAALGITTGCNAQGDNFCPNDLVSRGQMATFLVRAFDLPESEADYFGDDSGSVHEDSINRLVQAGLTQGCRDDSYCADHPIERAQMAAFLTTALDLAPSEADFFDDDSMSTHEAAINSLATAGVTGGCGADAYCPSDHVTRAQMATFLARALGLL